MSHQSSKGFVDVDNARLDEQRQVMEKILDSAHCPFCPENLALYHKQPIIMEGKYWLITKNQWPYDFTKHHYLAIYKNHVETLQELEPEAGAELFRFFAELEREFAAPGGGFSLRFGDTAYSAGTVNHLHAQFIVPDVEAPGFQPVRLKFGKGE